MDTEPIITQFTTRYDRIVATICKSSGLRTHRELKSLEDWFRKKSNLLKGLNQETLLDVIQHCEFVTREKDDVIIHQGEKGHRFYIVLRGSVGILLKESLEDVILGEEGSNTKAERSTLGNHIATLGEGSPFGEIALMNPDCIRTASVVAEERTDLVVIHRDLYNRSVKKVVAREYTEKIKFIESLPLIQQWMPKFRKQLAASFKRESYPFDCVLFKQGDPATDIFFILKGEVKLVVDPEAHYHQYEKFMDRCGNVIETQGDLIQHERAYFPQKLLPQIARFSRMTRASQRQRPESRGRSDLPQSFSPSAIRKMNSQIHARKVNINLCFLGEKQCVGDIEALLNLELYHATAICSQETVVMKLHRSHFERLFRKRNPTSTRDLAHTLELQLTRRILKPNIADSVPLLTCFAYRLQEQYGDRKPLDSEESFTLPSMNFDIPPKRENSAVHGVRGYSWEVAARSLGGSQGANLRTSSGKSRPKSKSHLNGYHHDNRTSQTFSPDSRAASAVGS